MKQLSKKVDFCHLFLFAIFIVCFIRIFFGFDWSDEAYYSALSYRFMQGDKFFIDSWDSLQISFALLIPFIKISTLIFGSTDYLYLFLRVIYTVLQFFVSIIFYNTVKIKKNDFIAFLASIILFISSNSIRTIGYKTIPDLIIPIIYVLLITSKQNPTINSFLIGLLTGIMVLSFYSLALAIPLLFIILYMRSDGFHKKYRLKFPLVFLLGGSLIAIFAFTYLFNGIDIYILIQNVEVILKINIGYSTSILNYFSGIVHAFGEIKFAIIFVILLVVCLLGEFNLIIPKKVSGVARYIVIVFTLLLVVINVTSGKYYYAYANSMVFTFLLLIRFRFKYDQSILLILLGFVYSFGTHIMSNMGFVASFQPLVIVLMGTILYSRNLELIEGSRIRISYITVFSFLCFSFLAFNILNVYRDEALFDLNTKITTGPAKGLYTSKEKVENINSIYRDLDEYTNNGDYILFSELLPFGYLYNDLKQGSPLTWRINLDNDLLEEWYSTHPERKPDVIYLLNNECSAENGNNTRMNSYIKEYTSSMKEIDVKCGTIFKKK